MSAQKLGLIGRLSELKSSAVDLKPISETEKANIETDLMKWRKQVKLRKTAVKDLWYMMKDTPKSDPSMKDAEFWVSLSEQRHVSIKLMSTGRSFWVARVRCHERYSFRGKIC